MKTNIMKIKSTFLILLMFVSSSFLSTSLFASQTVANQDALVQKLAQDWDVANYQLKGDAKAKAFEDLIAYTDEVKAKHPDDVGILIWEGIIKSTYAGVKGGLGALSLAKESRAALEKAIKLDGEALDGSAYTSLGTLYSKMPGWPVAFGDADKARKLLEKALEIDPDGIDSNYFYADYLMEHGKSDKAEKYLLTAQHAQPRADRPIGDYGRQAEIELALKKVRGE